MSRTDASKVNVPDDLRDILLEFTISYLIEQPPDIVDYAVDFFTKLQQNRRANPPRRNVPVSPDDSIISNEEGTSEHRRLTVVFTPRPITPFRTSCVPNCLYFSLTKPVSMFYNRGQSTESKDGP